MGVVRQQPVCVRLGGLRRACGARLGKMLMTRSRGRCRERSGRQQRTRRHRATRRQGRACAFEYPLVTRLTAVTRAISRRRSAKMTKMPQCPARSCPRADGHGRRRAVESRHSATGCRKCSDPSEAPLSEAPRQRRVSSMGGRWLYQSSDQPCLAAERHGVIARRHRRLTPYLWPRDPFDHDRAMMIVLVVPAARTRSETRRPSGSMS